MSLADRRLVVAAVLGVFTLGAGETARADNDPAVLRALPFLRAHAGNPQVGETALTALALLKADIPASDPAVSACMARIRKQFLSGGYVPDRRGGHDVYEAAVVAMALSNLSSESRRAELEVIAQYLHSKQKANGSWDYDGRDHGDTSISQYAVLGLWEADNGGANVPPTVWDHAADWFISVQGPMGSWNYHRDEPGGPETVSMTAAGVGSLLICQRQLNRYRRSTETSSALLTPILGEGQKARYDPSNANARLDAAIRRGMAWIAANFTTDTGNQIIGQSAYYGLYGIERIGALADRQTLGRVDWFEMGRRMIHATQRQDGSWDSAFGDVPNTCWAVLFITKSTAKTIKRIEVKSLGAGTLLGGRGLPKDLSNLTVAGGRVVSRPMNGAVEGMLAVLEDPRAELADSALSGIVGHYRTEGAAALRPQKDRFLKLLKDRDPGLRKLAAWSLARTGDLDTAPALIESLTDPDEGVVTLAREGLQLLSRKISGFGPPTPSTPAQREAAAARWRSWYAAIRPLDLEGQIEAAASPPTAPVSAPAAGGNAGGSPR
jgi:hypothetical protein